MNRFALLACMLLPLAVSAQMYKWVDEKGVTHYTDSPPPDGKGAKVDIRPATGGGGPAPAGGADWKQKEADARQQRIEKDQKSQQAEKQDQDRSTAKYNNCAEAQRRLDILTAPRPVYETDDKGQKVYLDDKERDRAIANWQANVKKYCE